MANKEKTNQSNSTILRFTTYILKRGLTDAETPTVRFTAKNLNRNWPTGTSPDGEQQVDIPLIEGPDDILSLAAAMTPIKLYSLLQKLIANHFAGGVSEKIKKHAGVPLPTFNQQEVLEVLGRENKRDGSATRRKAYETELKKAKAIKTSIREAAIAAVLEEYADVVPSLNDEKGDNVNG